MPAAVRFVYRGTTAGWPGNPVLQRLKLTTASFDPLVATLFALEAATFGEGIVQCASLNLIGSQIVPANVFADLESEIVISVAPPQFQRFVVRTLKVQRCRQILSELGFEVPPVISSKLRLDDLLRENARLVPKEIDAFNQLSQSELL